MSFPQKDVEVLKTKIDLARDDIKKMHPLLSLLEPQDREQIAGFAEKMIAMMIEVKQGYLEQDREFRMMRQSFEEVNRKLDFLLAEIPEDEASG